MRKLSPAMIVALAALFVALSGVGVAATGGNFILGQSNTATTNTSLSAPVAGGKALQLTNNDTSNAASTALGLNVASGHAPFTVNTGVKVNGLNTDKLDGFDSASFLPKTGKAADADKLDGIDSTGFVQGAAGRMLYALKSLAPGQSATIFTFSGFIELQAHCSNTVTGALRAGFRVINVSQQVFDVAYPGFYWRNAAGDSAFLLLDADVNGSIATAQVGQTYKVPPSPFPRTRIVTFFLSAAYGDTCQFQAQALAQGY